MDGDTEPAPRTRRIRSVEDGPVELGGAGMSSEQVGATVMAALRSAGVERGDRLGLAVASSGAAAPSWGATSPTGSGASTPAIGLAAGPAGGPGSRRFVVRTEHPADVVAVIEREVRPRWVMWSADTASSLVRSGVRVATSWDLAAVHRLLVGGWRADPARVWAWAHDLPSATIPTAAPVDLFHPPDDGLGDDPVGPDGYLAPAWIDGCWAASPERLAAWAAAAMVVADRQVAAVGELGVPMAPATARAESTAELLGAELAVDGLPLDRDVAEALIAGFVGPRPTTPADAEELERHRQAEVLRFAPAGATFDLRSPAQVKALLGVVGLDVPDTRAWRLESLKEAHPIVEPLLAWRKAERIGTTYGYGWLDEHLGDDGRLHGTWSASDGAAGRMTASAGLHNMPAVMRSAVVAEPGHLFVRADLGQIEPRVLAAVSGDAALARATVGDDLYAPVAAQLDVDRATAKVAVLGAMYGQTTGHGARALRGLHAAYPVAMAYLDTADRTAQRGEDLRTYGGRRVRMGGGPPAAGGGGGDGFEAEPGSARDARSRAAARGRYGRNAMVQGAAAELFKVWAVTVRARVGSLGAAIVLCLHDELLVHTPSEHAPEVAALVDDALGEAAHRWAPDTTVRFVADTSVVPRWSDAKA
jgi:DNA polymerase-1